MNKIIEFGMSRPNNVEHYKIMNDVVGVLDRHATDDLGVDNEVKELKKCVADEGEALNLPRGNDFTEDKKRASGKLKLTVDGIDDQINSGLNHYEPQAKAAFKRLKTLWDANSEIKSQATNPKEGALKKVLVEFKGNYKADVTAAGIQGWVDTLEADYAACLNLEVKFDTASQSKTKLRSKSARKATDAWYNKIIEIINALIVVNGDAKYAAFVNDLNERLKWHNNSLAIRKADRKDDDDETKSSETK